MVKSFEDLANPFVVENKEELLCLSSSIPAPPDMQSKLMFEPSVGKEIMEAFVEERLADKTEFPWSSQTDDTLCSWKHARMSKVQRTSLVR